MALLEDFLNPSEARHAEVLRVIDVGFWEWQPDEEEIYWSVTLYELFGVEQETFTPTLENCLELIHPADVDRVRATIEEAVAEREPIQCECRITPPTDQEVRWIETRGRPVPEPDDERIRYLGTARDVSNLKASERLRESARDRLELLFEVAPLALVVSTPDGRIRRLNRYFEEEFGFSEETVRGAQVDELGIWSDPADRKQILERLDEHGRVREFETRLETASGETRNVEVSVGKVDHPLDPLLVWAILDVTDRHRFRRQLERQAIYDPVTDLPNRTLLLDRLRGATKRALESGRPLAVLFVDLDDFKAVNDEYGHRVGDQLLRRVGERIRQTVGDDETVARIAADEFVVVLEQTDRDGAVAVGEDLLTSFDAPFEVAGHEIPTDITLGIAVRTGSDDRLETPEDLLRASDSAVYRARRERGGDLHVFAPEDEDRLHRLHRKKRIRAAIEHDELTLYFQPIVDLEEGTVRGAEALVRWDHPEYGLIPAADFVPFAEEVGLIGAIDHWVIERSVRQAARWAEDGLPVLRIQVNVSGRTASERDLPKTIFDLLETCSLSPDRLELEITERIAVQDTAILERLREQGIRLAIDDFGTGHSSLLSLRQLEADTLKLDRQFTKDITSDTRTVAIVRGVLGIARELGAEVIGEGIETEEQRDRLAELGCTRAQGYLIARPLPAQEFESFVRSTRSERV